VYALYHPAAALRSGEVERQSFADVAGIPAALLEARRRRATADARGASPDAGARMRVATMSVATVPDDPAIAEAGDPLTFF
jgi:hypothetical protein